MSTAQPTTYQPTTIQDDQTTRVSVNMTDYDIRAANVTGDEAIVVIAVSDDVTKVSLVFYENDVKVGEENVFESLNAVNRIKLYPLMPGSFEFIYLYIIYSL